MADQLEQLSEHARPFLDDGEELIAAVTASPRGKNTAMAAGGVGSMIGFRSVSRQVERGKEVGLRIESNMAVVLTQRRLLTLKVGFSARGAITDIKQLLSWVPLSDVDAVEAKRVGLGGNLMLKVRGGEPVWLECHVGRARRLVQAFTVATAPA